MSHWIFDNTTDHGSLTDPLHYPKELGLEDPLFTAIQKCSHEDFNRHTQGLLDVRDFVKATYCSDFTALRGFSGSRDGHPAIALGGASAGDGLGGQYFWSSTSTATDDSDLVIKPVAVSGAGRWLRLLAPNRGIGLTSMFSMIDFFKNAGWGAAENTSANITALIQVYFTQIVTLKGVRFLTGSATSRNWRVGVWDQSEALKASNVTPVAASGINSIHSIMFDTPYVLLSSDLGKVFQVGVFDNAGVVYLKINSNKTNVQEAGTGTGKTTGGSPAAPTVPLTPFVLGPAIVLQDSGAFSTGGFTGSMNEESTPKPLELILG